MYTVISICFLLGLAATGMCSNDVCYFQSRNETSANKTICIQMDIAVSVGFLIKEKGKTNRFEKTTLGCNSTHKSVSTSVCNSTSKVSTISIFWDEDKDEDDVYKSNLTFTFQQSGKDDGWNISRIEYSGVLQSENDTTVSSFVSTDIIGNAKKNNAYMCNSTNNLTLAEANEDDFNVTAYVALSDFKVKAFNFDVNATNGTYGTVSRCSQDIKGSKIVPIAVGAALAGLVVIVLIAYIIGRLRSRRQSSYEALS